MLIKAEYPTINGQTLPFITTVAGGSGTTGCRDVKTGGTQPAMLTLCISDLTITGGGTIEATDAWQW